MITTGSPIRITLGEVMGICKELRNGQAPGSGGIPGELLKYGTNKLYQHLGALFQNCIDTGVVPTKW